MVSQQRFFIQDAKWRQSQMEVVINDSNASTYSTIGRYSMFGCASIYFNVFEFPVLPMAPYLKLDFSDVPVLLGVISMGQLAELLSPQLNV